MSLNIPWRTTSTLVSCLLPPFALPNGLCKAYIASTRMLCRMWCARAVLDRAMFVGSLSQVLIGVDRLDYIKGMPHKLLAVELLLKKHPEWVGKVVLVQASCNGVAGDVTVALW